MSVALQNSTLDMYNEIVTYTVKPEQQQELFDTLLADMNDWMHAEPGFYSANCHNSEDGTRVVCYIDWRTRADWERSQRHPKRKTLNNKIQEIGGNILPDTHGYKTPKIVKGVMPERGVVTPMWGDGAPNLGTPGENTVVVLSGEVTNNTVCIIGFANAPGAGPTLHYHTLEDEVWYVIEGEFEFQVGENKFRALPGTTVFGPRNVPHAFHYAGETGLGRIIITYTPGGIEKFFTQLNEWGESGVVLAPEVYTDLTHRFGVYFFDATDR
jgi:quercetin dioxygenase-like cupin family protein/heme-degrading monooxygenase HmoA